MLRSFIWNVIAGHVPDTWPALPDKSIGRTGTGTGVGVGVGEGVGLGVGVGVGVGGGAVAAACIALTGVPATISDTARAAPAFDAT